MLILYQIQKQPLSPKPGTLTLFYVIEGGAGRGRYFYLPSLHALAFYLDASMEAVPA